jgi:DNA polymerase III epsilon subunit family exonuclease
MQIIYTMTHDISTLDFVAFDTETTGLQPYSEGLVEVAAVRFDLVNGPKEYFQTLVHPGKSIPANVIAVHGITDEMVKGAPTIDKVLPSFYRFLDGAIPVAHNASFDIGFLALHSLRSGILPPEGPVLDSCMFSRRMNKEFSSHRLEYLVKDFGISESTFHRALADAKSCAEVFRLTVAKSCGIHASWEDLIVKHGKIYSFLDGSRPMEKAPKAHLEPIFQTVQASSNASLWITYEGGFGAREVTPLLLYARGASQYMEATCHLDGIRKSFRLDRIKRVYARKEEAL